MRSDDSFLTEQGEFNFGNLPAPLAQLNACAVKFMK
jgi:hypothetical protein